MKTITRISTIFLLVVAFFASAQQISFENVNSNNALAIITQLQTTPQQGTNSESINFQYGNHNFSEIYTNGKTDVSTIQIGDYNYLNFNNMFDKKSANPTITTQGNNNIIDITGSNSISEKIQLHVKGDNMTIFMRNY